MFFGHLAFDQNSLLAGFGQVLFLLVRLLGD